MPKAKAKAKAKAKVKKQKREWFLLLENLTKQEATEIERFVRNRKLVICKTKLQTQNFTGVLHGSKRK